MVRLLRLSLLTLAVIIAAGLLPVPVSAAPQSYVCPDRPVMVSRRLVLGVANRVKSTDTQAVAWLCAGRTPAELVLASRIGKQSGLSIDQVFTLRSQGQSWDTIIQTYDIRTEPGWAWNWYRYDTRLSGNPFKNRGNLRVYRNRGGSRPVMNGGTLRFMGGQWWIYNPTTGVWSIYR